MRIITGEFKGRKLETPANNEIRPTSDKVKEALFSILMNDIPGAVCCDLFAGTGNLGLEAISRGAELCYFCDNSREAAGIIRRNIIHCGAEDRSVVFTGDFRRTLAKIRGKVDIFFVDPPYKAGVYEDVLSAIDSLDLLSVNGIIIAERESRTLLPERAGSLVKVKERRYGKTCLDLYMREDE